MQAPSTVAGPADVPWIAESEPLYDKLNAVHLDWTKYPTLERPVGGLHTGLDDEHWAVPLPCAARLSEALHQPPPTTTTTTTTTTLGAAIQRVVMARLRDENAASPLTEMLPASAAAGGLWLGDMVDSVNYGALAARRIGAVVSLHPRDFRSAGQHRHGRAHQHVAPARPSPVRHHYAYALDDDPRADLAACLPEICARIHRHRVARDSVLVHCAAGRSRSYAAVVAYRLFLYGQEHGLLLSSSSSSSSSSSREGATRRPALEEAGSGERFDRMQERLAQMVREDARKRPLVSLDNFRLQVLQYAADMTGHDTSLDARFCQARHEQQQQQQQQQQQAASRSGEKGGGGYLKDSVVVAFFLCRLRPTRQVLDLFAERRDKYAWPTGLREYMDACRRLAR